MRYTVKMTEGEMLLVRMFLSGHALTEADKQFLKDNNIPKVKVKILDLKLHNILESVSARPPSV